MALTNGANMGVLVSGAQGEAHYNELLKQWRALDGFLMGFVISKTNTPPGSPSDGDMYIVGTSPTGAWSGHANAIARYWQGGAVWEFFTPREGWTIRSIADDSWLAFDGSDWNLTSQRAEIVEDVTGLTRTLAAADSGKVLVMRTATAALTIPTNASVPLPVGYKVTIGWADSGQSLSVSGITYNGPTSFSAGDGLTLIKIVSPNTWAAV